MHFPTKLGTRLALFRERDSSGQSMHLYQPVFLKAFDWKQGAHLASLFSQVLYYSNMARTWLAVFSQGPLIENQVLTWPGKEWRMSWAGLAACCFRESITSPFVLRSYQVSILTVRIAVFVLLKIFLDWLCFEILKTWSIPSRASAPAGSRRSSPGWDTSAPAIITIMTMLWQWWGWWKWLQ